MSSVSIETLTRGYAALAARDEEPDRWRLDSLRAITSSGVTWSPETKRGLLAHVPHVTFGRTATGVPSSRSPPNS